jgi:tetratricopeptide (TPR) repeat protein
MKGRCACWLILAAVVSQSARGGSTIDPVEDFKVARQSEQNGDLGRAAAGYEGIRTRSTALRKYADRRLALLARSTGNLMLERIILLRSRMQSGGDAIAVTRRLAENAYEAGNNTEAVRLLTQRDQRSQNRQPSPRSDAALLGNAYLANGESEKARTIFTGLIESTDTTAPDASAITSVKHLDLIEAGSAVSEDEHLRRAAIYQANREFESARKHFKAGRGRFAGRSRRGGLPAADRPRVCTFLRPGGSGQLVRTCSRTISRFRRSKGRAASGGIDVLPGRQTSRSDQTLSTVHRALSQR